MKLNKPFIIGMIHLPPTMSYSGWLGIDKSLAKAIKDLKALETGGVDGALIENDADSPCKVKGEPDVLVPMAIVCHELKKIAHIPLGVEVLLNDPKASLTIAKTCGLDFVRTDYFVDKMMRDGYGEFEIDLKGLMAYRERIKAQHIKIFADVQVKYAKMLEVKSISTSTKQAIKSGADGVVITGEMTGSKPLLSDLSDAKSVGKGKVPILVGSGFSVENAGELFTFADGAIVGTSIKTGKYIDEKKVISLMNVVQSL